MKTCTKCGESKELGEFALERRGKYGRKSMCKKCDCNYSIQYRIANPEKRKEQDMRWRNKYPARARLISLREGAKKRNHAPPAISESELEALTQNHEGTCDMGTCERKATHLDHCHKTGRVRGILCNQCNTAIGLLEDSMAKLQAAIDYLLKAQVS